MTIGGPELVDRLRQDEKLVGHKAAKEGIEDMALLFKYLDIFNVTARVSDSLVPPHLRNISLMSAFEIDVLRSLARAGTRLLHRNHL